MTTETNETAVESTAVTAHTKQPGGLVAKFAMRFGVEGVKLIKTLKDTAFKQSIDKQSGRVDEVSNEELMALLIVADQYGLNPFTKEVYAFKDRKRGGIVPVVGVDGWIRIVQQHPAFDGVEFTIGPEDKAGRPAWVECTMYRKDRAKATTVREYLAENRRETDAWSGMPHRMLRHRAWCQCARVTFGFAGIHDDDEARQIIDVTPQAPMPTSVADLNSSLGVTPPAAEPPQPTTIDATADLIGDPPQ